MIEPGACPDCGSAIWWYRKAQIECANCHPEPFNPFAEKVVVIEEDGRYQFRWLKNELEEIKQRRTVSTL